VAKRAARKADAAFWPLRVATTEAVQPRHVETRFRVEVVLTGGRCVRVGGELAAAELAELICALEGGPRC
jgi:hypothetical protein